MPEILLNKKHTVGRPYFVGGFRTGNRAIIDHLNSQTSKTMWLETWVAMSKVARVFTASCNILCKIL